MAESAQEEIASLRAQLAANVAASEAKQRVAETAASELVITQSQLDAMIAYDVRLQEENAALRAASSQSPIGQPGTMPRNSQPRALEDCETKVNTALNAQNAKAWIYLYGRRQAAAPTEAIDVSDAYYTAECIGTVSSPTAEAPAPDNLQQQGGDEPASTAAECIGTASSPTAEASAPDDLQQQGGDELASTVSTPRAHAAVELEQQGSDEHGEAEERKEELKEGNRQEE